MVSRRLLALIPLLALYAGCAAPTTDDAVFSERSGLYWQRCAIGATWDGAACVGEPARVPWSDAAVACSEMGPGYRLPTLDETAALLGACTAPGEAARCAPCAASAECSGVLADLELGTTWTADPLGEGDDVVVVDLDSGVIEYTDMEQALRVRCVVETL